MVPWDKTESSRAPHTGYFRHQWNTSCGGVILVPFMGSGSAGVAALQLGYRFIGIEKSAHYFDIVCKRMEREIASSLFMQSAQPPLM